MAYKEADVTDKIYELGKRRGFFWPSYEIYGGVAGFYDLGPYGVMLKNNIVTKWKRRFIYEHQDLIVEIETPVIGPEKVFVASGHVESFTDPIVECLKCKRMFRADQLLEEAVGVKAEGLPPKEIEEIIREKGVRCPVCGGELGEVRLFNLLFKTQIGPYTGSTGYLRPETAQGMFLAFKRVFQAMREKLPIGIAQVGRVARNEISPRQGMIRMREFTIMEFEFFFDPENPECDRLDSIYDEKIRVLPASEKARGEEKPIEVRVGEAVEEGIISTPWMAYWMWVSRKFLEDLGVPGTKQFFEEKLPEERAHYSRQTFDQLVETSRWGWIEVSGHAYRGDYDLSRHMEYSGEDLRVFKKYEKPVIQKKLEVKLNKALLGRMLGEKMKDVENALMKMDLSALKDEIERKGYVEVCGIKVPKECVSIVEKEVKLTGRRFIPHVVEPSFGCERLVYITLEYAYRVKGDRVILSIPRDLAPVKVAVLPLLSKGEMVDKARAIYRDLMKAGFTVMFDSSGSIGRRYARADELGIPASVTIDYRTLEDNTVTIRDRDSWKQVRVPVSDLEKVLRDFINGKSLEELGEPVQG